MLLEEKNTEEVKSTQSEQIFINYNKYNNLLRCEFSCGLCEG